MAGVQARGFLPTTPKKTKSLLKEVEKVKSPKGTKHVESIKETVKAVEEGREYTSPKKLLKSRRNVSFRPDF